MVEGLLASNGSDFGMIILVYTDLIIPLALEHHFFFNHQELTWICELGALLKLQCTWTWSHAEAWDATLVGSGRLRDLS